MIRISLMSRVFLVIQGIFIIVLGANAAAGPLTFAEGQYSWLNDASLKATIEAEDLLYEWEYENPDLFEYEEGDRIRRGEEAKASFEGLLQTIDLSEETISSETIDILEEKYGPLERVAIRRIDMENNMQTWIWKK